MYLGIDIGASKTLFAVFDGGGKVVFEHKIPTSPGYKRFLANLEKVFKTKLRDYKFKTCCCAVPGLLDRKRGVALDLGNLNWHDAPIAQDIKNILHGVPVAIENDANLAGLSEALLVHSKYKKVLYLTVSTGIGDGIIINGKIDPVLADSEAGQMLLNHDGKIEKWEEFASGRALVARFGKKASELDDKEAWKTFAGDLALGIQELLAVIRPEVVIIGGGVGAHYEKFSGFLEDQLAKNSNELVKIPPIIKARRPEEAVIYGCYDYARR